MMINFNPKCNPMRNALKILSLLIAAACSMSAQSIVLYGTVYNTDKKPVADWPVLIMTSPATNVGGVRLTTNADGYYEKEFSLNPGTVAYVISVQDPCQAALQIQKAEAVEGKFQHDFVICSRNTPGSDPCDGKFSFVVHSDGWVEFHAGAVSDRVEFHWEFGDGTNGTGRDVRHQYGSPGVYEVSLVIAGTNCKKRYVFKVEVRDTKPPTPPTQWDQACCGKVNIAAASLASTNANHFVFRASAGFPIKEVHWDFGDGQRGTGEETRHAYSAEGRYKVVTTIVGEFCRVELITWIHVGKRPEPCNIDFGFSVDQLSAKFRADLKGQTADKLIWNFGDGSSSSDPETSHTYARPGIYKVTLLVSIGGRTCEITKEVRVGGTIDPNDPCSADFRFLTDQLTVKLEAAFKVRPDKFYWDLGDGNSSAELALKHTYAKAGVYTVVLYYVVNGTECKVAKRIKVGNRIGGGFTVEIAEINPNPGAEQPVLTIRTDQATQALLVISDLSGMPLRKVPVELEAGDNRIPLVFNDLRAGSYLVTLIHELVPVSSVRFQKM
jgi:PKD repeat protein